MTDTAPPEAPAPLGVVLSYPRSERAYAAVLARVERLGHTVWFDRAEISPGDEIAGAVLRGLKQSDAGALHII